MLANKGVPVHDTIARVMGMISGKQLQKSFSAWMKNCHDVTDGEVVAIDGKTLRGTYGFIPLSMAAGKELSTW